MYKFAFKNLWLKKTRSMLALLGLAIAVAGIIGLTSISGGIRASVTDMLSKMEGVTVMQKDVLDDTMSSVPMKYIDDIKSIPGIKVVTAFVTGSASNIEDKPKKKDTSMLGRMIMYVGADPGEAFKLKEGSIYNPEIKKGRFLKSGDTYSVVIGKKIADDYGKAVGNTMTFNGKKFKIVGIFDTGSQITNNMMYIPIDAAREFTGKKADVASIIYAELKNPKDAETVSKKINFKFDDVEAKSGSGYGSEIGGMMSNIDAFFIMISLVAIVVGAIGILNTMLMSVMERMREFGILRAIGWTSNDVIKLVVFESFFLGLVGGIIGSVLGLAAVQGLGAILPFKPVTSFELMATAIGMAMFLGVLGGLYPAWKTSKLDPVAVIRYG